MHKRRSKPAYFILYDDAGRHARWAAELKTGKKKKLPHFDLRQLP